MARVTVEDCVDKIPNRFDLVLLSAQRARQISGGAELTIDRDRDKNPVVALREVAEQTVKPKELEEALVGSLQRVQVDEDDVADEVGSLSPVGRGAAPHRRGPATQQQCGRRLRRLTPAPDSRHILQWTLAPELGQVPALPFSWQGESCNGALCPNSGRQGGEKDRRSCWPRPAWRSPRWRPMRARPIR